MNKLPQLFAGIFFVFATSWIGLVAYPYLQLGHMQPVKSAVTGEAAPPPLTGSAVAGSRVYAANGCIYCHSQQVRPAWLSTDIEKGWGPRQTVPRDYLRERPSFLGTMRTGPDLSNIGVRQPSVRWHFEHLYEPDVVTPGSIMPSFRFLFVQRPVRGKPGVDAVAVRGPNAPPPGHEVIPTQEARDLVTYLLSLRRNEPLPEADGSPVRQP
ncbi:MAG: cbb3-type cytochrome c oxidase subunit II [Terrimicrobiaceae bacterium]|nr:cbb3-type cytochrome c oxidase subunit II [Terrimicrobiaceae bacterium]